MIAAIERFAASDQGKLAALACDRWGVDPATLVDDDVLGFNLRVGLAAALRDADEEREPTSVDEGWDRAGDDLRAAWLAGAR